MRSQSETTRFFFNQETYLQIQPITQQKVSMSVFHQSTPAPTPNCPNPSPNPPKLYQLQMKIGLECAPQPQNSTLFQNATQFIQFIKHKQNFTVNFQEKSVILNCKLRIGAFYFSKEVDFGIKLDEVDMEEVQEKRWVNRFLKGRLQITKFQYQERLKEEKRSNLKPEERNASIALIKSESSDNNKKRQQNLSKSRASTSKNRKIIEKASKIVSPHKKSGVPQNKPDSTFKLQQLQKDFKLSMEGDLHRKDYKDGSYYIGQFENGQQNGQGSYFQKGGSYKGQWKNGKPNGEGVCKDCQGHVGKGTYVNGKRFGPGQDLYANGDRYIGFFKNDQRHGEGKYFYIEGDSYEGQWQNGLSHGKGIEYYADGSYFKGFWKNDEKEGQGQFHKQGRIIYQTWENGKLIHETQCKEDIQVPNQ